MVAVKGCVFWSAVVFGLPPVAAFPQPAAQAAEAPPRSRDRGDGLPLSMFGTYISKGELVVYPFYEYYRDGNYEYEAGELGYAGTEELRGRYRAHEALIFLAYGVTDRLAFEFEAATITASLDKSPSDTSALPTRLEQSGLGDVEAQLRWRWNRESDTRPEVFSYFETVFPVQRKKLLIGTTSYEYKFGTGIIRGLRWGTITARAAVAHADGSFEPGEYALEYLRRISPRFRLFAGVEGSEDEVEAITEAQVFLRDNVVLKVNNAFGITSKAPGWAPEIGVAVRFGRR
jgi:hypothetical protein